jgi:hypothetical protein
MADDERRVFEARLAADPEGFRRDVDKHAALVASNVKPARVLAENMRKAGLTVEAQAFETAHIAANSSVIMLSVALQQLVTLRAARDEMQARLARLEHELAQAKGQRPALRAVPGDRGLPDDDPPEPPDAA